MFCEIFSGLAAAMFADAGDLRGPATMGFGGQVTTRRDAAGKEDECVMKRFGIALVSWDSFGLWRVSHTDHT